jgi:hypothetical protein
MLPHARPKGPLMTHLLTAPSFTPRAHMTRALYVSTTRNIRDRTHPNLYPTVYATVPIAYT